MKNKLAAVLALAIFVTGCVGMYQSIITVTQIRKDIMNEYGALYRAGKISPELDTKIMHADVRYLQAAKQCEQVLLAYKNGTATEASAQAQLTNVKNMLAMLLGILEPYLVEQHTVNYNNQLAKAVTL